MKCEEESWEVNIIVENKKYIELHAHFEVHTCIMKRNIIMG